ncbi:hypothetical protein PsYK624_120550 [Phanerochaete sordida]|uniref:Uncharacterized protein n=1 Tax=Phanerochaete sordida TaxID=48140 RepID=A0A9P3GKB8_9APHY|nr:hypothetical protein PsYK624_120550 [Phanerochaete sordida]
MACLRMTKTCQGPHGKPKDGIRQLSGRMDLCVASSREHDKRKNARQHIKACILPATRHPKTLTTNSAGIHRLRSAFDNRNAQDRDRSRSLG